MMAPFAQALVSTLLAAQPGLAPASLPEREIAISGALDEPPAVLYGAPDVALAVIFDGPLKKDGAVAIEGADVRSHPFIPNALVITPSSSLVAARSSLPVAVPLADGGIDLALAFSPERRDSIVRVVRRARSAGPMPKDGDLQEMAILAIQIALDPGTCASAESAAVPRQLNQVPDSGDRDLLVCGGGVFAYVRLTAPEGSMATSARLTRGEESADVLLIQRTPAHCRGGTCWLVVARMPQGDGLGFELELLTNDGVPCHRAVVDLKPRPL